MSAREGELLEEALKAFFVLGRVAIGLAPNTFQIEVRDQTWSSVAWTRDDKSIKIVLLDHAVEVNVPAMVRMRIEREQTNTAYVKDWPASLPQ